MGKEDNLMPAWEKGQSGNPNGRPKGSKSRSTIARYWLEATQTVKNPLTGKDETLTQEDLMTLALIKKGRGGDVGAYKALMDSGYGGVLQKTDITTDGEKVNVSIIEIAGSKIEL